MHYSVNAPEGLIQWDKLFQHATPSGPKYKKKKRGDPEEGDDVSVISEMAFMTLLNSL